MKKIILSSFLLLLAIISYSQEIDKEAKAILEKIKIDYDKLSSVEMEFQLDIEIPEQAKETQQGKIIQSKDNYQVNLDDQAIYCNGEFIWVHLKGNKEVQINDYEEDDSGEIMSPKDILSVYDSGEYSYALTNEQREEGKVIQQIEFKPLDRDSEYSKMRLTIHKKSQKLKRIKVFGKDGSRFTMSIKSIKENLDYPKSTFTFDETKFPGIHIEDLRL